MNGLEIAHSFFTEWGLPTLHQQFPDVVERVAAGIFRGSQVFEADDTLSRDHGWGPMFLLLLTEADYAIYGDTVAQTLSASAPHEWRGYQYLPPPSPNVEVTSIDRYLDHWLGFAQPPEEWRQWLGGNPQGAREYELYLIRHGHVFYDPLGELSARRAAFQHYPHLAWLQRVWDELFAVWHYGQYNFLDRLLARHDPVAMQVALGHFSEAVMRLSLLLEEDYTPYWKWLPVAFRRCSSAARLDPLLYPLAESSNSQEQADLVREVCAIIHEVLDAAGLANQDHSLHPHSLYRDQVVVQRRIEQEQAMNSA